MISFEHFFEKLAGWVWNTPLLILRIGGGAFFMFYGQFLPFRYFGHTINVLRSKYDDPEQINHFQALAVIKE